MSGVNDFGLKIAKFGYNVATAGDIDLIFSSSWPSLPIAFEGNSSVYNGLAPLVGPFPPIAHNLGFPPLTVAWMTLGGTNHVFFPSVNSTNIIWNAAYPSPINYGNLGPINFKCFNVDISKSVSYPFIASPAVQTGIYDNNYGIKVSKSGKDVTSSDLRDFILHSRCQSPQVQAITTGNTPAGDTLVYSSGLGYVSWVFGYVLNTTGLNPTYWQFAPYYAQAYPITNIDNVNNKYSLTYHAGDQASLVILKDPMFASTKLNSSY